MSKQSNPLSDEQVLERFTHIGALPTARKADAIDRAVNVDNGLYIDLLYVFDNEEIRKMIEDGEFIYEFKATHTHFTPNNIIYFFNQTDFDFSKGTKMENK